MMSLTNTRDSKTPTGLKNTEKAQKKVFTNKEFGGVKRRAKAFKKSVPGKKLKKEMIDLKKALKKNVKVEDKPEWMKKKQNLLKDEATDLSTPGKRSRTPDQSETSDLPSTDGDILR